MSSLGIAGALALGAGVSTAGSVATGIIGANAAGNAANTQSTAAEEDAQLQTELGQEGLNVGAQEYNNTIGTELPALETGYGAVANLDYLMGIPTAGMEGGIPQPVNTPGIPLPGGGTAPGYTAQTIPLNGIPPLQNIPGGSKYSRGIGVLDTALPGGIGGGGSEVPGGGRGGSISPPGGVQVPGQNPSQIPLGSLINPSLKEGSLAQGFDQTFQAPTLAQAENNPGYKFQLQQGEQALQDSAAAQGGLITGGEGKALTEFGQGLAQTDYQQVYNNALQQYQQAYNIFQGNQANLFNRYSALAGGGQVAANQLGSTGANYASNTANTLLGFGNAISNANAQGAGARASGYIGGANALGGALTSGANSLGGALSLSSLLNAYGPPNMNSPSNEDALSTLIQ